MSALQTIIRTAMDSMDGRQPWLRFDRFMELCLYADEVGYYSRPEPKVGPDGDFYTSSNIGSIMGEMIAAWLHHSVAVRFPADKSRHVVEWGGGTGRLAQHILDELQSKFPDTYHRMMYAFSEISPYHQQLQQEAVAAHATKIMPTSMHSNPDGHVVELAHELLDAFPCRRMKKVSSGFEEFGVVERDGQFQGEWRPVRDDALPAGLTDQFLNGQQFEWVEGIESWLAALDTTYPTFTLMAIDYGDVQDELLSAHRMNGTFVCYRKHQVSDDPFVYLGEQDMTAHVNFTQVARMAEKLGWQVEALRTQKQFLLESGILNKLEAHGSGDPFSAVAKRNRAIRQLLISDQMSELFKVFIAHK